MYRPDPCLSLATYRRGRGVLAEDWTLTDVLAKDSNALAAGLEHDNPFAQPLLAFAHLVAPPFGLLVGQSLWACRVA
jgi:hypothetical protein